jgi:hypothetical protein
MVSFPWRGSLESRSGGEAHAGPGEAILSSLHEVGALSTPDPLAGASLRLNRPRTLAPIPASTSSTILCPRDPRAERCSIIGAVAVRHRYSAAAHSPTSTKIAFLKATPARPPLSATAGRSVTLLSSMRNYPRPPTPCNRSKSSYPGALRDLAVAPTQQQSTRTIDPSSAAQGYSLEPSPNVTQESVVPSVLESSTWMMMLAGFAALGLGALRRRARELRR